jgi:hypothetical protein
VSPHTPPIGLDRPATSTTSPRPPIPFIPLIHAWPLAIKRSMSKLADKKGQMHTSHQTPHDFVLFTWYYVQHRCVCLPFLCPCNNFREITPARCQVVLDNYWPDHSFPFSKDGVTQGQFEDVYRSGFAPRLLHVTRYSQRQF